MFTSKSQPDLAIEVMEEITSFMKTIYQLDLSLDQYDNPTLCELFQDTDFYRREFTSSLNHLRMQAGACLFQACQASNIEGVYLAYGGSENSLADLYEWFQEEYSEFVQVLAKVFNTITYEFEAELPTQDLRALSDLSDALTKPLLKSQLIAHRNRLQETQADG